MLTKTENYVTKEECIVNNDKCEECKKLIINALKQITGGKKQLEQIVKNR